MKISGLQSERGGRNGVRMKWKGFNSDAGTFEGSSTSPSEQEVCERGSAAVLEQSHLYQKF